MKKNTKIIYRKKKRRKKPQKYLNYIIDEIYDDFKSFISKIILISILLVLFSKYYYTEKNNLIWNPNKNLNNLGKIDESKLLSDDHYKILLPKVKNNKLEKIKPEDVYNIFKLEESSDYKKMKETGKDTYIYYSCLLTKVRNENLYIRDYIEYYMNLGVEKFYFGDDNQEGIENLSDVIDDYIKKGIVDIEYTYNRNWTHYTFFEYSLRSLKLRCKWFLLLDIDEYLEFTDKNMKLKNYLEMPVFNKCDVIRIHWMMYDDNNLIHYDKRPIIERLNHPSSFKGFNIYHKSIMRGKDYGGIMFSKDTTNHSPNITLIKKQCDAIGNYERLGKGRLTAPKFKYCFIRHYTYKTVEEFALKLLRGRHQGARYKPEIIDSFFKVNKFSEEKLKLIEHITNRTVILQNKEKYSYPKVNITNY